MKALGKVFVTMFLLLPLAVLADPGDSARVNTKDNVFVLHTEKKFIGAKVEIFSSNGQLLTAQTLRKKKMIIDFGDAGMDTYTIRLSKGDQRREVQYQMR